MHDTVVFLYAGTTSWTVPSDWPGAGTVECIGAGGRGANGSTFAAGRGGGGGAYSRLNSFSAAVGATVACQVPAAGTTNGVTQGDCWFGSTATVLAKSGSGTSTTGGAAGSGVGNVKHSGGSGSANSGQLVGAGGGAAGPNGAGGNASGTTAGAANAGVTKVWTQTSDGATASPGSGGGGTPGTGNDYGGGGRGGGAAAGGSTAAPASAAGIIIITYTPTSGATDTVYKGAQARSARYLGNRTDAQLYLGTKQLFPA